MSTVCQACNSKIDNEVFFAGWLPLVNSFSSVNKPPTAEQRYPARLLKCDSCGLVQMENFPPPNLVFPKNYAYRSGTTRLLLENFAGLAEESGGLVGLTSDDLVVDIASNDGSLLKAFEDRWKCRVQGVEPTDARITAHENRIPTLPYFWDDSAAENIVSNRGKAKLVTACNVFAHVPDPKGFLKAVDAVLLPHGVLAIEVHYLPALLSSLQYDTIYHEHIRYYSLGSLQRLLDSCGFHIFRAKRIPTHGGSLRIYAYRKSECAIHSTDSSVAGILEFERGEDWEGFRSRVAWSKASLWRMLEVMKRSDSKIYGIGCPSRAVTLIHYCGLDHNILDCVCEVPGSPKIGHYVPGTRIPVVDESKLIADQPDFALILSWHIATEIACKLRARGYTGRFMVPLTDPKILEGV